MTSQKKLQKLEEAKGLLQNAVNIVTDVFLDHEYGGTVRPYWIDQVSEHIKKQNQYNLDINDLIDKIQEDQEHEE